MAGEPIVAGELGLRRVVGEPGLRRVVGEPGLRRVVGELSQLYARNSQYTSIRKYGSTFYIGIAMVI